MELSGWQLAARALPLVIQLYIVKESPTTFGTFTTFGLAPGQIPLRATGPFTIPPGARFPYGALVVPD